MVLKLYGFSISTNTRLVALICKEKEIPYELVPVDFIGGEHRTPKHLQYQPFGQLPYIDDDGFILYESRAIARYLIKKYPHQGTAGLIPTDPKEEALFEQASLVETFNFNPQVSTLVGEKFFKKTFYGGVPNQAKVEEYLKKVEENLDTYEVILGKQKYLAGDHVTLADLQHLPYGTFIFAQSDELLKKRPNVARWWKEIFERPAWQAVKNGA